MRIVLTTWGSLGDLHPYLAIGTEMKRRGHEVAVATLPVWESSVGEAGLTFYPLRPDVPQDDARSKELVRKVLDAKRGPEYLIEHVLSPVLRETYEDCLAAVRADGGADLLITHQIPITGPLVAEVTGVSWVSGVLLPMAFLSDYDPATSPQAPWIQNIAALHPAIAGVFHRVARRVTRKWAAPTDRLREGLGLGPGGHPFFEGQHSPALVLALFSRVLTEKQPDFPPQTVITGFPFYDGPPGHPVDRELLRFLDAGEPPIVFTLGSSAVWIADDFYTTAIAAVRALGRRAILLAGDQIPALRSAGLPDTIAAFEYAPHSVVMPRGSAIVHQGGVGTTGQALRAGRPQLVVPFGQDQPDNARRCVRLGVARTISRAAFRRDRVAAELSQLFEDGRYGLRAGEVAAIVRSEEGTRTACDEVERRIHATLSPWKTWKPPSAT